MWARLTALLSTLAPSRPLLSPRAMRTLLAWMVVVKLAATAWDIRHASGVQYDTALHGDRAMACGMLAGPRHYDAPLYYFPTCLDPARRDPALSGKARENALLTTLRYTNLGYAAVFLLVWVFAILPRLLPDPRAAFVAGAVLLATPAYQRNWVMAHADNALAALMAVALALWLRCEVRSRAERLSWGALIGLGFAIGLTGVTRPFSAIPVVVLCLGTLWLASRHVRWPAWVARAAAVVGLVGLLSGAWPVYRYVTTGWIGFGYDEKYVRPFVAARAGFDRWHFFTSFYLRDLVREPNRGLGNKTTKHDEVHFDNRYANSFFTLAFSETWGDHWLYVSGKVFKEEKLWPKRLSLVAAAPTAVLLPLGLLVGGVGLGAAAWRRRSSPERAPSPLTEPADATEGALTPPVAETPAAPRSAVTRLAWPATTLPGRLVALAILVLGGAAYLYWQGTSGLLPGKNSTVKFMYNSHLFPVLVALAATAPLPPRVANALILYVLLLFGATLPMAIHGPF